MLKFPKLEDFYFAYLKLVQLSQTTASSVTGKIHHKC